MKNLSKFLVLSLCMLISLSFSLKVSAQQSLTSITGWNAYVHLPSGYATSGKSYPTIIFFPGLGEVGTSASRVIASGPGAYISQGWNGNVVVDGTTVEFIVISLQPSAAYPSESRMNQAITSIKSLYRVDNNKLYLTGLSHGGWCSSTFVTGDPASGPYTYANQIAAVVTVQGMRPDDNAPYPNLFDNYAKAGGKYVGFEQRLDGRDTKTVVDRMNATKANSAFYIQTNFGGGGHCCWNEYYGGGGTQPGNFNLEGRTQNIYQWMARQSRGSITPPANTPPVANAGSDKTIVLPTNTVTLNGSGTDANGSVSSYSWRKVNGPSGFSILNPSSPTTVINNLTQGIYEFELTVTDNNGTTGTDKIIVNVNAATAPSNISPVVNAGYDITLLLPVNSTSLSGSATDNDGNIASYLWTKISGPASTLSNATSAVSNISGLVAGTYTFEFKATDNLGASSTDRVTITVNAQTLSTGKKINVNVYNGTLFNNAEWNNWNTNTMTSAKFKYTDGTISNVNAVLGGQAMIVDNGSSYASGATVFPQQFFRYNSASTSNRTVTIKGLDKSKKYDFEFAGSRASTGNKTTFKINTTNITVTTDNNITNVARFTNISPDNSGNVVVTLSRVGVWNYFCGFTISEAGSGVAARTASNEIMDSTIISEVSSSTVKVFPNPFVSYVNVELNEQIAGKFTIILMDAAGRTVFNKTANKSTNTLIEKINVSAFPYGNYFLQVISEGGKTTHQIQKLIPRSTQY